MAQVRGFLDRFRPAGAPGAAARAGVPADRARERQEELGPVLALLDDVHSECGRIIEEARQEAEGIAAAAQAEVAAVAGQADHRARAAHDEAAEELLEQARRQARRDAATADRQAARVRRLARRRLPGLAAKAVGLARAGPGPGLAAGPGGGTRPAHDRAAPGAGTGRRS